MKRVRLRRRVAAVLAAFAALAGSSAAAAGTAWRASPDDALLLDVRLASYRLGDGVRGYATPGGACLIFADVAATLDLAVALDEPAGTARGWAFTERNRIEIDRKAGRARIADRVGALDGDAINDSPEGWCVDAKRLGSWLGVALDVDQSNALLLVKSAHKLPVELAAERKRRAAQPRGAAAVDPARLPRIKLPYLMWRSPSLDAVVTLGGIRDTRRGSRFDRRYELFASGEAARLSVDARLASDRNGVPASLRMRAYRTDPGGALLGPLRATHFALGDVSGASSPLVGVALAGRGAMVTNRPVDRADSFDRTSFRGELPIGWDAELYRNGQLLAFAQNRSDGRYEFLDVALLYGQNRFEIVLYGPQGQVRRRTERVAVGAESIPGGETYYWAGISQDDRDLLALERNPLASERGWRGTVALEHGLDTKTSLAASVHSLVLRNERLTYVEGAVRRAVGPALVELSGAYEAGGGLAARAHLLGQFGDTYVSAESVKAFGAFRSDRVEAGISGRHALAIDHAFIVGSRVIPVHAEARYVERRREPSVLEAAARLSTSFRNISLTGGLDWTSQRARGRDPPDRIAAALLANGRVGAVRLRGEARYRLSGEGRGFEGATLVGEWGASDRALWRGEVGYDNFERRARAAVGYSRRFDRFALGVTGEAASDGSVAAGVNLAFSVGPSPRGGFRVTSSKVGSSGTAIARVFRDNNSDGVRQPDEPLERGVQLTAGTSLAGALTDARGQAIIEELTPDRPITIGVDTTSLADPLVQPAVAGQRVVPRPGVAFKLDIPLVGAGEVEGSLVSEGGRAIEGIELQLVATNGQVAATQLSDFDGFFLFERVPYGDYTLRIAPLSATAGRLDSALGERVLVGTNNPTVRLGPVKAAPAKTIASK